MSELHPQPWNITLLLVLLILLGLGGIGGGIVLLMDPSGELMGLPPGLLEGLFIADYLLPGFFLILGMGFLPYLVGYSIWKGWKWAWIAVLGLGIFLIAWIIFQILLWGSPIGIQYLYLAWGMALVLLALHPATRQHSAQ